MLEYHSKTFLFRQDHICKTCTHQVQGKTYLLFLRQDVPAVGRWKSGEGSRTGESDRPSLLKPCCVTELSEDSGNAANKTDLEFIYFPLLKSVMLNVYITRVLLSLFAFRIRLQSVRRRTCVNEHGSKIRIGFVSYVSDLFLIDA